MTKIIYKLLTVFEIACLGVILYEIFNPGLAFVKPLAIGLIFVFFTVDALVTGEASTRINVINRNKSPFMYYLMTVTYLMFAIFIIKYAYELWQKQ